MSLILIEAIDCFLAISGIHFPVFSRSLNLLSLVSEALVMVESVGPSATAQIGSLAALLREPGPQYLFDHHWYFQSVGSNRLVDSQRLKSILDNAFPGTFAAQ